ncbi:hypothetical protein [Euzebya rosea]|uniref:hypothetical protein n=1 Tax=Euzebya rosea TaxID=2052804 RepID=UPI0013006A85|nr:hypothetical protein [Euzebya rosea]
MWDPPTPTPDSPAADDGVKPGHRTSEFSVTVAVMVCALLLALAGRIEGEAALAAITAQAIGYGAVRAAVKRSR